MNNDFELSLIIDFGRLEGVRGQTKPIHMMWIISVFCEALIFSPILDTYYCPLLRVRKLREARVATEKVERGPAWIYVHMVCFDY